MDASRSTGIKLEVIIYSFVFEDVSVSSYPFAFASIYLRSCQAFSLFKQSNIMKFFIAT
jgi:hypothetical protein